ncbi:hypothetical protein Mapa_007393 [Marchantia paleacea]|nr:hypothetical protein Mapa_007393 [Marchantia paleacea]
MNESLFDLPDCQTARGIPVEISVYSGSSFAPQPLILFNIWAFSSIVPDFGAKHMSWNLRQQRLVTMSLHCRPGLPNKYYASTQPPTNSEFSRQSCLRALLVNSRMFILNPAMYKKS